MSTKPPMQCSCFKSIHPKSLSLQVFGRRQLCLLSRQFRERIGLPCCTCLCTGDAVLALTQTGILEESKFILPCEVSECRARTVMYWLTPTTSNHLFPVIIHISNMHWLPPSVLGMCIQAFGNHTSIHRVETTLATLHKLDTSSIQSLWCH